MNVNMLFRMLLRFGPQLISQFGRMRSNKSQTDENGAQKPAPSGRNMQQSARMLQRLMRMMRF